MKQLIFLGSFLFLLICVVNAQHSIRGYIVSLETAKPIANAKVILNDQYNLLLEDTESFQVTSDSTGFYKISGIKEGRYIINAWTTYHALDQRYAMLISSNIIEVHHSLEIDFVFSENAFKYRLDREFRVEEAIKARKGLGAIFKDLQKERNSDAVARRAIYPQIFIDSKRDTIHNWYIEKIGSIEEK